MKAFLITLILCIPVQAHAVCVVLLHGLARSDASMSKLEQQLEHNGFDVVNLGYPSRAYPIEELAEKAIGPALQHCPSQAQVSFVTHSLGGILVRQYLSRHEVPELDRVVMLGPPNKGSEVVDVLGELPGFHFINGDAGLQLGTGRFSVPNALGPATFDLGIIAGSRSINLVLSSIISGVDDGKVSVERTKLEGMSDHLVMPVTHTFMMKNDRVIAQIIYYLQNGQFEHM